ncbi:MAG: BBP7 family outer membrane beta-barrel protein [Gemmataceae bacterium]|nr:BBP7 family outer membrane beta-barrel protein [Gemmataceae bacterium]MDW8264763.1 BBP7 family outer membrane beta-barrel protein [Gemmataceae bacterium]
MRTGYLGVLGTLLAGAGWAWAQATSLYPGFPHWPAVGPGMTAPPDTGLPRQGVVGTPVARPSGAGLVPIMPIPGAAGTNYGLPPSVRPAQRPMQMLGPMPPASAGPAIPPPPPSDEKKEEPAAGPAPATPIRVQSPERNLCPVSVTDCGDNCCVVPPLPILIAHRLFSPPKMPGKDMMTDCLPPPWFWVTANYLLWWIKDGPNDWPLVTTADTVLVGGQGISYGPFSGIGGQAGAWLDANRCIGLEGGGFWLPERHARYLVGSGADGLPAYRRPAVNALTGGLLLNPVSIPGERSGSVLIESGSQLWGAEAGGIVHVWDIFSNMHNLPLRSDSADFYVIGGFRYLDFREDLDLDQVSRQFAGSASFGGQTVPAPANFSISERFDTRNQFYGGYVGGQVTLQNSNLSLRIRGRVGLGACHQVANILGTSTGPLNGVPTTLPGGFLALPTNSGRRAEDVFAVIPEVTATVGYQFTRHVRAFAGYSFLWWNEVLRPGAQISPLLNPTLIPSNPAYTGTVTAPFQPVAPLKHTDFWVQGLNFGVTIGY